jgi:ATP-binding cassette subfamily G (WHITE) protein 2 (SNQ2)
MTPPQNFSVICAFYLVFLAALLITTEYNTSSAFDRAVILFRSSSNVIDGYAKSLDEEKADAEFRPGNQSEAADPSTFHNFEKNSMDTNLFTWQHLRYEVPIEGGMKCLLDDVTGFVVPGKLTALMGESGAGKV